MKGIVKLNIKIQIIGTQEEIDEIIKNPKGMVDEECFITMNRRILDVSIADTEYVDEDVNVDKMLDSRPEESGPDNIS